MHNPKFYTLNFQYKSDELLSILRDLRDQSIESNSQSRLINERLKDVPTHLAMISDNTNCACEQLKKFSEGQPPQPPPQPLGTIKSVNLYTYVDGDNDIVGARDTLRVTLNDLDISWLVNNNTVNRINYKVGDILKIVNDGPFFDYFKNTRIFDALAFQEIESEATSWTLKARGISYDNLFNVKLLDLSK